MSCVWVQAHLHLLLLNLFQFHFQQLLHLLADSVLQLDRRPHYSPLLGRQLDLDLGPVLDGGWLVHIQGLEALQQREGVF